jgi:short-subunit dehydrogenase
MNIVITGASKGLGKGFALEFAKDANQLVLCARNKEELEQLSTEINKINPNCIVKFKIVDVSIKQQILDFGNFCNDLGDTDILINNAGIFLPGSIYEEEENQLEKMINTNLYSAYHLTKTVLPKMMFKKQGHIFNICSIASNNAYANGGSYSISKFALLGFSKNLREELKPHGIKVTAVLPGAVYTNSWAGSGVNPNRIMEVNDIASLVYAASKLSPQACVDDITITPQLGNL